MSTMIIIPLWSELIFIKDGEETEIEENNGNKIKRLFFISQKR